MMLASVGPMVNPLKPRQFFVIITVIREDESSKNFLKRSAGEISWY